MLSGTDFIPNFKPFVILYIKNAKPFINYALFINCLSFSESLLLHQTRLAVDLKQALCYSGKLTSLSLICFEKVGKSWLNRVMISNPHMQSLSICHIETFADEGNSFSLLIN